MCLSLITGGRMHVSWWASASEVCGGGNGGVDFRLVLAVISCGVIVRDCEPSCPSVAIAS
jgi:hypothetical protein